LRSRRPICHRLGSRCWRDAFMATAEGTGLPANIIEEFRRDMARLRLRPRRQGSRCRKRSRNSEADAVVTAVGFVPRAVCAACQAEALRVASPATAATNALTSTHLCPGGSVNWGAIEVFNVAVLHPLPYIERADGCRLHLIPSATAAVAIGVVLADVVTPGVVRVHTFNLSDPARNIFPLSLAEQAITIGSRNTVEPSDIVPCAGPVDVDDRAARGLSRVCGTVSKRSLRHGLSG
jgi:hypothetical protein